MELTFDNVYNLLDSTEYTTETLQDGKNSIRIYNRLANLLLKNFFPDYKIHDIQITPALTGSKFVGPKSQAVYQDVTALTIKHYYPTTIDILNNIVGNSDNSNQDIDPFNEEEWSEDLLFSQPLIWNVEEYPILYNFLLKNINQFREKSTDNRVKSMVNILINFTFGVAIYGKNTIKCYNPSLIMSTINRISEILQKVFDDYIIYVDCDIFYFSDFDEALPKLKKMLDDWGYSYEIEKINNFLYLERKRVVISDTPFKILGNIPIIPSIKKRREKFDLAKERSRRGREKRNRENESDIQLISHY